MLATGNILQAKTLMNILLLIPLNTVNTDKYYYSILLLRTTTSKAALNAACWNNIYYSFCPIPTFLVPTIFLLIYHTTTTIYIYYYVGNAGLHWIKYYTLENRKLILIFLLLMKTGSGTAYLLLYYYYYISFLTFLFIWFARSYVFGRTAIYYCQTL